MNIWVSRFLIQFNIFQFNSILFNSIQYCSWISSWYRIIKTCNPSNATKEKRRLSNLGQIKIIKSVVVVACFCKPAVVTTNHDKSLILCRATLYYALLYYVGQRYCILKSYRGCFLLIHMMVTAYHNMPLIFSCSTF